MNKDIVQDVESIRIEVRPNSATSATPGQLKAGGFSFDMGGNVVEIELIMTHSNVALFPNAQLEETTTARTSVQATTF